jgi:hypothetical protein
MNETSLKDTRAKIRLTKAAITALNLLDERCKREQRDIINEAIINDGEDPNATWELKSEGSQAFLIKRGLLSNNGDEKIEDPENTIA